MESSRLHQLTRTVVEAVRHRFSQTDEGEFQYKIEYTPVTVRGEEAKEHYVHSIECTSADNDLDAGSPTIVMLPGYAAGALLFINNLAGLNLQTGCRTIAVDWIGTGASSRPKWRAKSSEEGIEFFLDAFEQWRQSKNLSNIVLVGHSLGGYLAAQYAFRQQERVRQGEEGAESVLKALVLASPVGVPFAPEEAETPRRRNSSWVRTAFTSLLGAGFTPQTILRSMPSSMGLSFVERVINARFEGDHTLGVWGLQDKEPTLMRDYLYHISTGRGSGEYALSTILLPGAWVRDPLEPKLGGLMKSMPVMIAYGDRDWMRTYQWNRVSARELVGKHVIMSGTHHFYLNSSAQFNTAVATFAGL